MATEVTASSSSSRRCAMKGLSSGHGRGERIHLSSGQCSVKWMWRTFFLCDIFRTATLFSRNSCQNALFSPPAQKREMQTGCYDLCIEPIAFGVITLYFWLWTAFRAADEEGLPARLTAGWSLASWQSISLFTPFAEEEDERRHWDDTFFLLSPPPGWLAC